MVKIILVFCFLSFELIAGDHQFHQVIKSKCVSCHNAEKDKGGFDLEPILSDFGSKEWVKVYQAINYDDMPPEEETPLNKSEKEMVLKKIRSNINQVSVNERMLTLTEFNTSFVIYSN